MGTNLLQMSHLEASGVLLSAHFSMCVYYIQMPHRTGPKLHLRCMPITERKMKKYNSRIVTVEKGTFTPLVYTTFGGCGPKAAAYHKRLSALLAKKRNEEYHHVINYVRTRIRFSLLRSVLIALRGERGKRTSNPQAISSVSFNLIPTAMQYESL